MVFNGAHLKGGDGGEILRLLRMTRGKAQDNSRGEVTPPPLFCVNCFPLSLSYYGRVFCGAAKHSGNEVVEEGVEYGDDYEGKRH